ncbi:phosphoadenylyl-sulfate reductase [Ancylobacter dichloromethanicus]|uniref:Adenosine 5'-phosphosulfate reductase n=1 Tax=Ancylobacter dichloromethanicus TaxID=518825 RepID=A0A9W6N162_9HYPH|nr:phosphoadenylyl-sulfate reductase [Ancylobacter dichloromethanicus]MBS7556617.1 phosphoadenylyl-sulfate reductase [Ancylobacter dichloromethanicus]GLK73810.1 phosphoadenosine phosphosulfate reductase [Ancylobacter dichloromethanicus]
MTFQRPGADFAPATPCIDEVGGLACALADASPTEIVDAALHAVGPGRLCLVSSFGTESAVLLAYAAEVDRSIPVVFLDTGWLFEETLAYRDTLTAQLGLTDVRSLQPDAARVAALDGERDLWFSDPDTCCRIRKVEPLARALGGFDGWLNGRKRYQGGLRASIPVVERDGVRLKFNPLANLDRAAVEAAHKAFALPDHPLVAKGFSSVGCMPCTSRASEGEDSRAGRWRGKAKTECGIHTLLNTVGN